MDPLRYCHRKSIGCRAMLILSFALYLSFSQHLYRRCCYVCAHSFFAFLCRHCTAPSQLHNENDSSALVSFKSSPRLISISTIVCCHTYMADLSPGRLPGTLLPFWNGNLFLEVGFTLRCLQRLSVPHFASLLCRWHDNSCTSGASTPVLSY